MTRSMRRGVKKVPVRPLVGGLHPEEAVEGVAEAEAEWPGVGEGVAEDAASTVQVRAPGGKLVPRKRVAWVV
jgi:hypothetical protein